MATEAAPRRVQMRFGHEELIIETGRMAKQAGGSVTVQYGGTMVLVSVVVSQQPREGVDFLPLSVEYQEKTYAAGRIPGGFFKREGRPSEKEILTCRLVDRPIRPLFPKGFRNDIQVVALVLSHDGVNDPDILAIIGASAALGLASAPVDLRVGACRVGRVNGEFVVNPTYQQVEQGDLDLVVASTKEGVLMVEAGAKEVSEEDLVEALRFGQARGVETVALQEELISAFGGRKQPVELSQPDETLLKRVSAVVGERIPTLLAARVEKEGSGGERKTLLAELLEKLGGDSLTEAQLDGVVSDLEKQYLRRKIVEESRRLDGRDLVTVRPIRCEVGILPRAHGSGLFTRGQTQSLSSATLGTSQDEQLIDALRGKWYKSFMLHYNFPPFSVGEVRPMRGPGRREIGHGALAERALRPILPGKEEFPYTVRLVSEILESNGSSSMATVCGGTLALMDAGVPVKGAVSGIAMGLVREGGRHVVLTDIIGLEDHYGDMDFKVVGTAQGITALQMDLKLAGVPVEVLAQALTQAKPARALVLERMLASIASPRAQLSPYAPRISILKIDPERIGELIGPGGKMIRRITQETGATVDVEDDGTVKVASADPAAAQKAIDFIRGLTEEPEIGRVYQGIVKRITNFGAFCEITPGKEGLCHVSELSDQFVPKVEDVVKLGDTLAVRVVEIDAQGRINLSHKQAATPEMPPTPPRRAPERGRGDRPSRPPERGPRGFDRGGRGPRPPRPGGGYGGDHREGRFRDRDRHPPHRGDERRPPRVSSSTFPSRHIPRSGAPPRGEERGFARW